jgi:hypothetical protein
MSPFIAAVDAEGAALGDAAEVEVGIDVVLDGELGDAVPEQAAIAIASAGATRARERFIGGRSFRVVMAPGPSDPRSI